MKIVIATGTRADWGLLHPLADELRNRGVEPMIAATNAHFFNELGNTIDEIEADGYTPKRIPTRRKPEEATADALTGFADLFATEKPDCVVILGDRYEMMGVATAALLSGIPIVHIAGGNITAGAYDNAIRNALSQMATLHLPETEQCGHRLASMGIKPDRIVTAGSPGVYNALNIDLMSLEQLEDSLGATLGEDFLLATLHPATLDSESPGKRMTDFLQALAGHMDMHPGRNVLMTYPNSDNDPGPLIQQIERFSQKYPGRVVTIASLGRVRYLSAAALCTAVIGNSSSAIEETPSLGHPSLDIGIRQEGRERGPGVFHCEADTTSILAGLDTVTTEEATRIASARKNPYNLGNTPQIQADAILQLNKQSLNSFI
ncbi:MAG: UDP-N-acetylglucosamine 2-epimerase [Clostridium sp.]|nr:UDP-N-acetylglucosamine 2-epimerase [Prevotella sp.]MCM1429137.1 UDP-N-acetylglucosamine 2-epimerase [Clostridium sp.]